MNVNCFELKCNCFKKRDRHKVRQEGAQLLQSGEAGGLYGAYDFIVEKKIRSMHICVYAQNIFWKDIQ